MINFKSFIESVWNSSGYRDNPIPMGKYNEDNVQGPHGEPLLSGIKFNRKEQRRKITIKTLNDLIIVSFCIVLVHD